MSAESGENEGKPKPNWFEKVWNKIFGEEKQKPIVKYVNVVVIFDGHEKNEDDKRYNDANREAIKKLDNSVVKITNIKNIEELKIKLKELVGNKKIKNLIICTHGSYNYLQLGEDGVSNNIPDSKGGSTYQENLKKFKETISPYLYESSVAFTGCMSGVKQDLPKSFQSIANKTNSTFYFDYTYGKAGPNRFNNSDNGIVKNPTFPNQSNIQRWTSIRKGENPGVTHSLYFTRKGNINRSPLIGR